MVYMPGTPRTPAAEPPKLDPNTDPSVTIEQQETELQKLRAEVATLKASSPKVKSTVVDDQDGDTVIVHFVRDGWTNGDFQYYQGQEVEFTVGNQAYKDTCDPATGKSWLDMRNDPREQERRKGFEFFRDGPWQGLSYVDNKFELLKKVAEDTKIDIPTRMELEAAELKERTRRRQAQPMLSRTNPRPRG